MLSHSFLGPRVHHDLVIFVRTCLFLQFFLSASPVSLWRPTQTFTQARCSYLPPNAHNTFKIHAGFIGRAGWWRAPTGPGSDCPCRICSPCLALDPSAVMTGGSAEGGNNPVTICWFMKRANMVTSHFAQLVTVTGLCKCWQWRCKALGNMTLHCRRGSEQ